MPVPTSLASLSTTPGSNPPSGAENPFPELDDHLRFGYACHAQNRDAIATKLNESAVSAFGLTLIDDADAATARTTLGAVGTTGNQTIAGTKTFSTSPVVPEGTAADHAVNKGQLDAATAGAFAAGDTKFSYQAADHGRWLMITGPQRTIGNTGSGATARANADTLTLYTLLWSLDAADVAIYDSTGAASTRGASAAADFSANKRIDLPNESGLVSKGHHGGNGALTTNTSRRLGSVELDEVKTHNHVANIDANVGTSNSRSSNLVWGDRGPDSVKAVTTTSTGGPENLVRNRSKNVFIYF